MLETNLSGKTLRGIFSQFIEETKQWYLVAFWSRKINIHKKRYHVGEQEMLTIVEVCKHWRYYVESALHTICVLMDHMNLDTFFNDKILKLRETRWWEKLSGLNLTIKY